MHGGGGFSGGGHHGGGFGGHHHSGISHHHHHTGDGSPGFVWAALSRRRPASSPYTANGRFGVILAALLAMAALTCLLGAR
jgi:hypothetical protein